jgi:hypothetical protein
LAAGATLGREAADAAETATTARAAAMMMSEVFMAIPFQIGVALSLDGRGKGARTRW